MKEQWYIVKSSCESCGGDTSLVGPFDTEKEADEFDDKNCGTGVLWKGTCAATHIVKLTSIKDI